MKEDGIEDDAKTPLSFDAQRCFLILRRPPADDSMRVFSGFCAVSLPPLLSLFYLSSVYYSSTTSICFRAKSTIMTMSSFLERSVFVQILSRLSTISAGNLTETTCVFPENFRLFITN